MGRRGHIWSRKGSGQWFCTLAGRQIPLGDDKDSAEREFHRLKSAQEVAAVAGISLGGLADHFMDHCEREYEPDSAKWYRACLRRFVLHGGKETPASQIQPKHVSSWLAKNPKWGINSRNIMISIVKRLYSWGVKEGHLAENPLKDIELPGTKSRELILEASQVATVMASVRAPAFRDLLVALRETGCRPIEVRTLTADRVNLDDGTWKVRNKTRRKTGEPWRTIYLTPAMIEISRRLMAANPTGEIFRNTRGKPWTRTCIVQRFIRIRAKTGFGAEAVAYSFRHLYITDALEKGIPPATVAELVGHKNLNMIMKVYSKLKDRTDHLREAAKMIRPEISPNPS